MYTVKIAQDCSFQVVKSLPLDGSQTQIASGISFQTHPVLFFYFIGPPLLTGCLPVYASLSLATFPVRPAQSVCCNSQLASLVGILESLPLLPTMLSPALPLLQSLITWLGPPFLVCSILYAVATAKTIPFAWHVSKLVTPKSQRSPGTNPKATRDTGSRLLCILWALLLRQAPHTRLDGRDPNPIPTYCLHHRHAGWRPRLQPAQVQLDLPRRPRSGPR